MSTEAPIERLEPGLGYGPIGLDTAMRAELDKPLDMGRVKKKPGKGHDYLAEHDVVRTANRIFGYGRWGTQVVELVSLGQHQIKNAKNEQGWYVGYRCTVRLTVIGCQPVDGVGYGDAFEKQWSGVITAHELAVKEAESDAIKRAFKKYGDQFGLILYAKDDERRVLQAEAEQAQAAEEIKASDEQIEQVKTLASSVSPQAREKTDKAIKAHRDKNETERGLGPIVNREWLTKLSDALVAQAAKADAEKNAAAGEEATSGDLPFKVPEGVTRGMPPVTDETPAADTDVADAFGA